jgi:hypothetical protein
MAPFEFFSKGAILLMNAKNRFEFFSCSDLNTFIWGFMRVLKLINF